MLFYVCMILNADGGYAEGVYIEAVHILVFIPFDNELALLRLRGIFGNRLGR